MLVGAFAHPRVLLPKAEAEGKLDGELELPSAAKPLSWYLEVLGSQRRGSSQRSWKHSSGSNPTVSLQATRCDLS